MKTCTKCKMSKDESEFGSHCGSSDGLTQRCKACSAIMERNRRAITAISRRDYDLLRCYGIDSNRYHRLHKEQEGKCAICGKIQEVLEVDHCHITQDIRGLLCEDCNLGLGKFKDDIGLLKSAIDYVSRFRPSISLEDKLLSLLVERKI